MMKLLSGEWLAAEQENKSQRDSRRKAFWEELGVTPAKDTAEISLAPENRVATLNSLIESSLNGKEQDIELQAITQTAAAVLSKFAYGSFSHGANLSNSMESVSPKALRAYFLTETITAYELSEFND